MRIGAMVIRWTRKRNKSFCGKCDSSEWTNCNRNTNQTEVYRGVFAKNRNLCFFFALDRRVSLIQINYFASIKFYSNKFELAFHPKKCCEIELQVTKRAKKKINIKSKQEKGKKCFIETTYQRNETHILKIA